MLPTEKDSGNTAARPLASPGDRGLVRGAVARREVLCGGAAFAAMLGVPIPFLANLAPGIVPVALAADGQDPLLAAKDGLVALGDRPINLETPPHLLDDDVTPAQRFFVRNHGQVPNVSAATDESWRVTVDGEVERPISLSIADLKREFAPVTLNLVIECAGNGRRFFAPGTPGNQWTFGGVGCAAWTGVRLRDLLARAGVRPGAVYTAHYGADPFLTGEPGRDALSRGVPIAKAMEENNLVAWSMGGAPMPVLNGHPLRLVIPGWPGSCSQKWLTRIWIRDRVHDGERMLGTAYRMPAYPVAPGSTVPDGDMVIIEGMPVKSLITAPRTGTRVTPRTAFELRGHAWAGERNVAAVHVSTDFGATWRETELAAPVNRYAWQRWRTMLTLPDAGYYEVWARATDSAGGTQPPVTPGWNPAGYNNNMQHRIAVFAV